MGADDRKAEDRLDPAHDQAPLTPQRDKVVGRLTWAPRATRPGVSTSLLLALVAVVVAVATVLAGMAFGGAGGFGGPGGSGRTTPFEGTWTSLDPADGSTQWLVVGQGDAPAIRFEDELAADICPDDPALFHSEGLGTITGNHLVAKFPGGAPCLAVLLPFADLAFDLDRATDELVAADGRRWTRLPDPTPGPTFPGQTDPPATDGPDASAGASPDASPSEPAPSEPTASDAPSIAPTPGPWIRPLAHANEAGCFDREADSSGGYEARAGPTWIQEDFISGHTPWHYLNDRFHLADGLCGHESALTIEASIVGELYTNACHWRGTGEQGRWDFVPDAIATQELLQPTTPTRVPIHIYANKFQPSPATKATTFQISVPADFDITGCDDGTLKLWRTSGDPEAPDATIMPGQVMTLWIVKIDELALVFTAAEWPDEMAQPMRDLLDDFSDNLFIQVRAPAS